MKLLSKFFMVGILLLGATHSIADSKSIETALQSAIPGLIVKNVQPTKVASVFRVETNSGETLFSSADGQYFFTGDMYSIENNTLQNLSESKRSEQRVSKINAIADDQKIVFPAKGERKGSITVFTDIDCGYCRKLHKEVPALNEMGVEVSYLAYPRAGLQSESYKKYVSAWCAEDKLSAITKAKNGQSVEEKVCANPIANQYNLGKEFGISGTPAIILDDGTLIPGYINATKIGQALDIL